MVYYFNPGHETAILNGSKHYHPPRLTAKLQSDLATLPLWYSEPDDRPKICLTDNIAENDIVGFHSDKVDFWGISPASVHYLETLNQRFDLNLKIPVWKNEYRHLGSRFAAADVLARLTDEIPEIDPDIIPKFVSSIEEIKTILQKRKTILIKTPFSSSGQGLLRLSSSGALSRSEQQILNGMLRRQGKVSVEPFLNKLLDFSMHFHCTDEVRFAGYSVFYTNNKGAYEKSIVADQQTIKNIINHNIDENLIEQVRKKTTQYLSEIYLPHYQGYIGIDCLIYNASNKPALNPCVEINMRKSMGLVALKLFEHHISASSSGEYRVDYFKNPMELIENHQYMQKQHPLFMNCNRIENGYLSLCPINETTNFRAYILVR